MSDTDALPTSNAQVVQAADEFQWDGNKFEAGIGIAASGGGYRSMLFHAGGFMRLAELELLAQAKRISSVSGGSIATAYLACVWQKLKQDGHLGSRERAVRDYDRDTLRLPFEPKDNQAGFGSEMRV